MKVAVNLLHVFCKEKRRTPTIEVFIAVRLVGNKDPFCNSNFNEEIHSDKQNDRFLSFGRGVKKQC